MKRIVLLLLTLTALFAFFAAHAEIPMYIQKTPGLSRISGIKEVDASPFGADEELLRITFVGIRQGDCILIEQGGEIMLIDGGEAFRLDVFTKYLSSKGIDHIDSFFLTHAHDDHLGLQEKLVRRGFLPRVQYSPYDDTEAYDAWPAHVQRLQQAGIPRVKVATGDTVRIGNASMQIYRRNVTSYELMNSHSVVSMLTFGDARVLFTGDIAGETEQWLLDEFGPEMLKADILKVPHHGNSRMHDSFVDAVSPGFAIITNQSVVTEAVNKQLQQHKIPVTYINTVTHCETNGKVWYIWREKMPK